jgi:GMP synthase-like glutamine amidotransferase
VRPDWRVSVYSVKDGQFPAAGARHDGWIITGSPASVHDGDAWVGQLFGLTRGAHPRSVCAPSERRVAGR